MKRLWHQMFSDDRTVILYTEALKTCWDILEQRNSNNGQKQVAKSVNNQSFKLMLDLEQLPQEQAFSH